MRRTVDYTVSQEGRDKGKVFQITEMPATRAEKWAMRAFLAMARSGVDIPENVTAMGLAGIAQVGLRALSGVDFADAEPLMDEMMACVTIMPDPKQPAVTRPLVDGDIEEVATMLSLRMEVWVLHTGFSLSERLSKSRPAEAVKE